MELAMRSKTTWAEAEPFGAQRSHAPGARAQLGAEVQVGDAQARCDGAVLEGALRTDRAAAEGERGADRAGVRHDGGWERPSGDDRERGARPALLLAQRLAVREREVGIAPLERRVERGFVARYAGHGAALPAPARGFHEVGAPPRLERERRGDDGRRFARAAQRRRPHRRYAAGPQLR